MKKYFSFLLIIVSLLIWVVPAQAATVPDGYTTWQMQTTTDAHKVWTVKLSAPMDSAGINKGNIYVTDDSNNLIGTTLSLSSDGLTVQVTPVSAYLAGNKYWLYISGDLTFNGGKQHLAQPIAMPFTVTSAGSEIYSVSDSYSSLFTNFSVATGPDVFSVKINSTSMIYQGNNSYSVGMVGLKQGSKVTVYAYDSTGKLLQSQVYIVN
ncbi:Ig-like domain-containing protein [Desulfosporosinus sp. FKA]|uniref:Ig-like domain-containing protein n=1 Tax=Desulfosporosinus sp. FKA TaxID=1969834 RepID=UPI001124E5DD|nr:Ig-like domain-containing protein [Desulfosporosinus sp. FKA]